MPITFELPITVSDPALHAKVDALKTLLEAVLSQGVRHMAEVTAQVQEVLTAIDTATTDLAARVDALIAKAVDSMDQNEADPLLAEARAISARLRGIAANPEQPVPPVEPPQPA